MARQKTSKTKATAAKSHVLKEHASFSEQGWFSKTACVISHWAGKPVTFLIATTVVIVWALSGPLFGYSDTWQLVINTSTTIITFLMVFLIQNTQNRDNDILHIKIDELLRATKDAQNAVLSLDGLDRKELEKLRKEYKTIGDSETITVTTLVTETTDDNGRSKTDLNQA